MWKEEEKGREAGRGRNLVKEKNRKMGRGGRRRGMRRNEKLLKDNKEKL